MVENRGGVLKAWVLVSVGVLCVVGCGDQASGGKRRDASVPQDAGEHGDGGAGKPGDNDAGDKPAPGASCGDFKCDPNATCALSAGKPKCTCADGFDGDGKTCTDVDECKSNNGGCANNAACVNQPGSFRCLCNEGLTGDGKTCTAIKVDECGDAALNTCDPNAKCTDTDSGFECACAAAFSGDGAGCSDVDECAANSDDCVANATCKNTFSSFSCGCDPGYAGDGKAECKGLCDTKVCDANATCFVAGNPMGTGGVNGSDAVCRCALGYVGDGTNCTAVAGGDNCGQCDGTGGDDAPHAICTGTPGSGSCQCAPGYAGTVGSCAATCATNNGGCGSATQYLCTDLPGGFACSCQPGYSRISTGTCEDVNECNETPGPCHPNATCTNTIGSFTCACNDGFSGDGSVCKDVDECATAADNNCLPDATCVNTNGSFACPCKRGLTGDGVKSCTDVDECAKNLDDCADNATCVNTTPSENPFGYSCVCKTGIGDGTMCSDIDECKNASLFDCPANSVCVNDDPGYHCACGGGFTGDDPKHCYCDLTGYWAMRQDIDVCWCDRVLTDVTIISGGSAEASVWELQKLTYDGEKVVVEKKGCGSDNEPDFVSPFFKTCPPGKTCPPTAKVGETYSSFVPNDVFDKLDFGHGKDIAEPEIVPGTMFTTPNEAALAGIDLGDNPETAPWPAPFTAADPPTVNDPGGDVPRWVDSDKDDEPGFTFWSHVPSEKTERSTTASPLYYSYTTVDVVDDNNGGTAVSARASCTSLATRVISHLNADVESCEKISGDVVNVKTEGRFKDCIKVPEAEWEDDKTCTADDWAAAGPADRCNADDVERLDATDQGNHSQATFEMVKIGEIGDDVDCAAVRKALPAIKRTAPTPISCNCQ